MYGGYHGTGQIYEMWDKDNQKWSDSEYRRLLYYITGDSGATLDDVTAIAATNNNRYASSGYTGTDSSIINSKSAGTNKGSGDEITIFLGDMYWTPVYLSQAKNGDTILTLWFADIYQPYWGETDTYTDDEDGEEYTDVTYYYINGEHYSFGYEEEDGYVVMDGKYSTWNSSTIETYPCNMYGTSYVNAVTLNNGGVYTTDSNTLVTATKKADNPFAILTIPENGLTQYLVTPRNMSWQENQNAIDLLGEDYCYSNESYSSGEDSDFSNSSYNYSSIDYYDSWADSYVWLPSLSELGNNNSYSNAIFNNGLWGINGDQFDYTRNFYDEEDERSYYSSFMLRSGFNITSIFELNQGDYAGMVEVGSTQVNSSSAIRPAIHLNLSAIYEELYGGESEDDSGVSVTILPTVSAYSEDYELTPSVIVKYDGVTLTQNVDYTITFSVNVSALTGSGIVQLIGSYEGARSFNFRIAKLEFDNGTYVVMSP